MSNSLPFQTVTIDGFRGLRNAKFEDLGAISILVGGNNSGKTSVLEAMSIAANPYDTNEWMAMVRRRDFGRLDETRIQSLRWCFRQSAQLNESDDQFEGLCEIMSEGAFPLKKLTAKYFDSFGYPTEEEVKRVNRRRGSGRRDIEFDEPMPSALLTHTIERREGGNPDFELLFSPVEEISDTYWEDERLMFAKNTVARKKHLPTETLTPYSYQLGRHQVRSRARHTFKESSNEVLEIVRLFDPEISGVEVTSYRGSNAAIYLNHDRYGPAPLSVFGDALRRAVLLSSTIASLRGGLLMIDEVETGIHVDALAGVFKWLVQAAKRFDVQVMATTHSLEAVDAMMQAVGNSKNDIVAYHLENVDEKTYVERYSGEMLHRLRHDRGLDVRS